MNQRFGSGAVAGLALILAGALTGCSARSATAVENEDTPGAGPGARPPAGSSSASPGPGPASSASSVPTAAPSSSLVVHNGTLESPLSDHDASVLKVAWAKTLTDSLHGTTKAAGRYFLVRVSMRNITKRPTTPPSHLSLWARDGREFAPEWDQTFGQTVLVGHGKVNDLNPGAKTTVVLVYDLPGGTEPVAVDTLRL